MAEVTEPTVLDRLREQRKAKYDAWATFIDAREAERAPFEERLKSDEFKALAEEAREAEVTAYKDTEAAFRADSAQRKAELAELDERIEDQQVIFKRRQDAADASKDTQDARVVSEPLTYRSDNTRGDAGLSYYRDLAMAEMGIQTQTGGTRDQARARLERHAREMEIEMPKRAKAREERAQRQVAAAEAEFLTRMQAKGAQVGHVLREMRSNGLQFNPFEQRVTPNSTDGFGGFFIPPIWLEDEYIPGLRAHLIAAGLPRQMDVPAGTNSINVPKLQTLTTIGYQQQNNAGLPSKDWTDTFVQANVKTIGGYSDVAIQLLEQSPHGIVDEVITTDLMAAYNTFLDGEVIAGDGTNANTLNGGHLMGLYPATNWSANSVTYTDASPTGPKFVPVFGAMASQIARTRFDASNYRIVLHGRRWFAYSCSLDANNRPLGESQSGGRYNIAAAVQNGLQAEGLVGSLPFVADAPVYIDDNVPINDTTGGGSNQDIAISGLWDDAWLFKSPLRTDVFREVESGSLGVRFRVYNYAAFLVRYGQSFAVATGSGFAAPTGAFTQAGGATSLVF